MNGWKKETLGKMGEKKSQLLAEIQLIDSAEENGVLDETIHPQRQFLQEDFRRKSLQEELKWKQRFRVRWLDKGDKNSNLFSWYR